MAHWHDFNPWADRLVYLPDFQELYENVAPRSLAENLRKAVEGIKGKYDIYLLKSSSCIHLGIRYGKVDSEYLSPYLETDQNQVMLYRLYDKYEGKP